MQISVYAVEGNRRMILIGIIDQPVRVLWRRSNCRRAPCQRRKPRCRRCLSVLELLFGRWRWAETHSWCKLYYHVEEMNDASYTHGNFRHTNPARWWPVNWKRSALKFCRKLLATSRRRRQRSLMKLSNTLWILPERLSHRKRHFVCNRRPIYQQKVSEKIKSPGEKIVHASKSLHFVVRRWWWTTVHTYFIGICIKRCITQFWIPHLNIWLPWIASKRILLYEDHSVVATALSL